MEIILTGSPARPPSGMYRTPFSIDLETRDWSSLAPDGSNTLVGYRGVDDGIRDRAMAHEGLQCPGIDSPGGQGVARSMAQHVGMNREGYLGLNASPLDQLGEAGNREWGAALTDEDKGRLGLTLQNPQRPELVA
jgi:hypothetical protein